VFHAMLAETPHINPVEGPKTPRGDSRDETLRSESRAECRITRVSLGWPAAKNECVRLGENFRHEAFETRREERASRFALRGRQPLNCEVAKRTSGTWEGSNPDLGGLLHGKKMDIHTLDPSRRSKKDQSFDKAGACRHLRC